MPASLPPMATMCIACYLRNRLPVLPGVRHAGRAVPVQGGARDRLVRGRLVWDYDAGCLDRREPGIQEPDDEYPGDPAAELGGDEHRGRGRGDPGEGVGEHAA